MIFYKIIFLDIFFTTNDFFYEEKKEKEKNREKKKYTKGQNQKTSKIKSSEQRETLIDTHMELSETQNNNKNMRLLHLNAPKKQFLYKWQKNSSYQLHTESKRAPLTNMENDTSRRIAMKRASRKKIKKLNSFNLDKENVKLYNITDHSNEGIYKGLNSITF